MKLASRILAVLLAVLWTVVGAHCQIEQLTGWKFLQCETQQSERTTDSHCEDSNCIAIEQGHYQSSQNAALLPMPLLAVLFAIWPLTADFPTERFKACCLTSQAKAPPRPWQFFSRAALPPRVPSFIS